MAELENIDRFIYPTQDTYVFLSPEGYILQCMGISPNTQTVGTETWALYTFVYVGVGAVLHQIDVNKNLEVVYLDGVLQTEPFEVISYDFKETKFSITLSVNSKEDMFKYSPSIHISENQNMGTINEENYIKIEEIWKDRLIGAINLKFTRGVDGLLLVDACVVNKGVVPDWS